MGSAGRTQAASSQPLIFSLMPTAHPLGSAFETFQKLLSLGATTRSKPPALPLGPSVTSSLAWKPLRPA